jgi:hypothetical protein
MDVSEVNKASSVPLCTTATVEWFRRLYLYKSDGYLRIALLPKCRLQAGRWLIA